MQRVQYDRHGGPEEMYIGEFALPDPGGGEVRVAVRAAAVNPLDWKLRQGVMKMLTGRRFPKAMGTDFAGVVEAVGGGVTDLVVGDEVFGTTDFRRSGAFAGAVIVSAANLAKKPAKLSFSEAACLPIPAMTAWVALLDRAGIDAGSRVFINGCSGAVGAFAVQLAIAHGAHVSGSCGKASRESVKAASIEAIFDYQHDARKDAPGNVFAALQAGLCVHGIEASAGDRPRRRGRAAAAVHRALCAIH
jgi:NADPH:quinone reductase-like Zn-dependent oxidoreductase